MKKDVKKAMKQFYDDVALFNEKGPAAIKPEMLNVSLVFTGRDAITIRTVLGMVKAGQEREMLKRAVITGMNINFITEFVVRGIEKESK